MVKLAGAEALVMGMGKSGLAAAGLLAAKGARVRACDTRPAAEFPDAPVPVLPQGPEAFAGVDVVVLSPGVPADLGLVEDARRRGVTVVGEAELAGWFLEGPVIGITGANGKTTTTALTGHILQENGVAAQVGGNIGWPPAAMVGSSRAEQWNVLELSSFQLETIVDFRAHVGAALNVTPDHLDRHGTFENYANAKARLFETQREDDFAVLNADDATTRSYAARTRARVVWFSMNRPVESGLWLEGARILADGEPLMDCGGIPLAGRHNIENVMAAAAAARLAGVGLEGIRRAVMSFPGVEHRLEFVREIRGVRYFNDSKATNVDAARKAADAFPGGLWIILGGKDKGSDYTPLAAPLKEKARAALLVGAAAQKIAAHLEAGGPPLVYCGTIEEAVRYASREARPGDVVLLAPACASFDQFQSYEHRGGVFKTLVKELVV